MKIPSYRQLRPFGYFEYTFLKTGNGWKDLLRNRIKRMAGPNWTGHVFDECSVCNSFRLADSKTPLWYPDSQTAFDLVKLQYPKFSDSNVRKTYCSKVCFAVVLEFDKLSAKESTEYFKEIGDMRTHPIGEGEIRAFLSRIRNRQRTGPISMEVDKILKMFINFVKPEGEPEEKPIEEPKEATDALKKLFKVHDD